MLVVLALGADAGRRRGCCAAAGGCVAARGGDPDPLWAELSDTAVDLGYVWSPARSPRQVAQWLARDTPASREALDALAGAVERRRYGPRAGDGAGPRPSSATG